MTRKFLMCVNILHFDSVVLRLDGDDTVVITPRYNNVNMNMSAITDDMLWACYRMTGVGGRFKIDSGFIFHKDTVKDLDETALILGCDLHYKSMSRSNS